MGIPTEYTLRSDDYVVGVIVFGFLSLSFYLAQTHKTIGTSLLNTFQNVSRKKHFVKRLGDDLNSVLVLLLQVSMVEGTLLYAYLRRTNPLMFDGVHILKMLSLCMVGVLLFQITRILIYRMVNHTFFSAKDVSDWSESHLLSLLFESVLLFPLLVIYVFSEPSNVIFNFAILGVWFCVELYRFTKLKVIFFRGWMGCLHIFLYFCMLNLAIPFLAYQILHRLTIV